MNVFIAQAEIAYEDTHVIGVASDLHRAVDRCRERTHADEAQQHRYDRHWVDEWTVNGDFVRQYDVRDGVVTLADEPVAADG